MTRADRSVWSNTKSACTLLWCTHIKKWEMHSVDTTNKLSLSRPLISYLFTLLFLCGSWMLFFFFSPVCFALDVCRRWRQTSSLTSLFYYHSLSLHSADERCIEWAVVVEFAVVADAHFFFYVVSTLNSMKSCLFFSLRSVSSSIHLRLHLKCENKRAGPRKQDSSHRASALRLQPARQRSVLFLFCFERRRDIQHDM